MFSSLLLSLLTTIKLFCALSLFFVVSLYRNNIILYPTISFTFVCQELIVWMEFIYIFSYVVLSAIFQWKKGGFE